MKKSAKAQQAAADEITRIQAEAHAAECGVFDVAIDKKVLARSAKAAYETFVREAGFQNDARIRDWPKLDYTHQRRWAAIARAVIKASRHEVASVRPSGIRQSDDGPHGLRPGVAKASSKKPANRASGARRR